MMFPKLDPIQDRVGPRKQGSRRIMSSLLLLALVFQTMATSVYAMPQDGTITSGEGTIHTSGAEMTVKQDSERLAIHWDSFDIGAGETVTFDQPGASSIALNRVNAVDPSKIDGNLQANGHVFLINPNGVIFGNGSSVNTAGFVASTLDIHDDDFFDGNYSFYGSDASGSVVNQGVLTAGRGGYVALLGNSVENSGEIHAPGGRVVLAAGESVTLFLDETGLFKAEVDAAAVDAAINNGGLIAAQGGHVLLTARAKDALVDTVINHTGIIDASSMEERGGVIVLSGGSDRGAVEVNGRLDVAAPSGQGGEILVSGHALYIGPNAELDAGGNTSGGFVETSGDVVRIEDGARVTTRATSGAFGKWLIDPGDYVIGPVDPEDGSSYMSHTALSSNLEGGDIEIATTDGAGGSGLGNITVDGPVSWDTGTTLTLKAHNDITINESISATSADSGLVLLAGKYVYAVPTTIQTGNVTLAADKEIRVGTLTLGGNPDVFTDTGSYVGSIGDVKLDGELHVGTFKIDRTIAGFGEVAADNANNTISKLESSGDKPLDGLRVRDAADGLDVFLDIQDHTPIGGITVHTQGNLTLLADSKLAFDFNPSDVVFVADGGAFINEAGADALLLKPQEFQRFLIYSSNTESTLTGGLTGIAIYGKTYADNHDEFWLTPDGISRFLYAPGDQPELILIAKNLERFYGDPNPVFDANSWIVEGLAEGENLYDVLFGGDPTLSTVATQYSAANTAAGYEISIAGPGLTSNKYQLRFQHGTLFVKPAPITLDIGTTTREYGNTEWDGPPTVTVIDGLKLDDTIDDLNIEYTYNRDATLSVNSIPTPISAVINNSNYTLTFRGGELNIRKAELTGQINTVTREYGDAISADSILADGITWTGFKNWDSWRVVEASFSDQSPVTGVGTYTLSGIANATNYNVTILDGTLEIVPAPLDIRIHNAQRTYGELNPSFSAEAMGLKNGDKFSDVFSGVYTTGTDATTGVGDYEISLLSHTMSDNYILADVESGTLTIIPATLIGDISQVQRVYGDSLTPSDMQNAKHHAITWSGFKNGDSVPVVSVILNDQPITSDVGTYALTGSASANNYVVILNPGTLEIVPAVLQGQIGNLERTYGETLDSSTMQGAIDAITWSGFKNGDNASVVSVSLNDQPRSANAGDHALSGIATSKNYTVMLADGVLTINPAVLNLHATSVTRKVGDSNPEFSMTATGMKFDEPLDSLIQYIVDTQIDSKTAAGTYVITIEVPGSPATAKDQVILRVVEVISPNYVLGNVSGGTLTIEPRPSGVLTPPGGLNLSQIRSQLDKQLEEQQKAEAERSNENIEVWNDSNLVSSTMNVFLTESNQTMIDAVSAVLNSGLLMTDTLRSYLQSLARGEKGLESWREDIKRGSKTAKLAFETALPYYAQQLVLKDESSLTQWDRRFLDIVGQKIAESRRNALAVLATNLEDAVPYLLQTNFGLSDSFEIMSATEYVLYESDKERLAYRQSLVDEDIRSALDLKSGGLTEEELTEIFNAVAWTIRGF